MEPAKELRSVSRNDDAEERIQYQAPAIIYEGKISIRAGSPIGPPDPFNLPGGGN